jgi:hypothetical protein
VFQSSFTKDEIQIRFSPAIISFPLKVSLQLVPNTTVISTAARLTPSEFVIPASSVPLASLTANLIAGSPAAYEIRMSINSSAYNISYPNGNKIQILSLNTEPPVPRLQSALFSNDGTSIILTFNSPTNRGKSYNSFSCFSYFAFKNVNNSQCSWSDDSTIIIYQTSSSPESMFLNVGQNLTLKSVSNLKAFCVNSGDSGSCNSWKSVSSQSIMIQAPLQPIAPVVQMSAPRLISPCQSLSIDLTSSTGNGGRNWKSIKLLARQSPAISDIQPLNQFLTKNYTFFPPGVIPSTYFTKGTNYTFQATLCNFLGSCGSKFIQVTINDNDNSLIPFATIQGSTTLNIYRRFSLQLKSSAYTINCRGETSYQSLFYDWRIINNRNSSDSATKSIKSTSTNPSNYNLPTFTLSALTTYTIQLTVTSTISLISSSYKVQVNVLQGSLHPVISGGSSQNIKYNTPATIDASQSYDDDQKSGSSTGLNYEWSCIPSSSSSSNDCSEYLSFPSGVTSSKLTVLPFNIFSINSTFSVFLRLFDRSGGRSASLTSTVKVVNSRLNSISILTVQSSVASFPTGNALLLTSTMDIYNPCRAIWTASSIASLGSLTSTSTSLQFGLGIRQPFNIRILPNALPERSSITFSLTCGLSSSAITVTTNGAPIPGEFSVNPPQGNELVTSFIFTASFWSDPDLPLTYQFGFLSPTTDSTLVTQVRSASSASSSFLPAGSDVNQNHINCSLQVFDVFNSSKLVSRLVTVTPLKVEEKQNAVSDFILQQSISLVGNAEAQRAFISVASTTLNSVNCTVPVNCSSLSRSPCRETPNTCGACLSGYHGDSGDKNTLCENINSFKNFEFSGGCKTNLDCAHGLQQCVNATCQFFSKKCPGDCSNNGQCQFKYVSTGLPLSSCTIDDLSCQAYCNCLSGYIGEDCSINQVNLPQIQATRSILIHTLKNLTRFDDVSKDSVQSWSTALRSIVSNPAEISQNDVSTVQEIALKTASAASDLGLQSSSLLGVLNAMDGIATSSAQIADTNNATSIAGTQSLLTILSQYSELASSELVYGEEPKTIIYNNFRISSSVRLLSDFVVQEDENQTNSTAIEVPRTDIEEILRIPKSSLQFLPSKDSSSSSSSPISISLIETYEKSYTSRPSVFYSDPIQFTYKIANSNSSSSSNNNTNSGLESIIFRIRHNEAISGFDVDNLNATAEEFRSSCTLGVTESTSYLCKTTQKTLVHHCNGSFSGAMLSYCPLIVPTCNSIDVSSASLSSNHSVCQTIAFTQAETICSCSFKNITERQQQQDNRRRRLASATELNSQATTTGGANLVAATESVEKDFVQTFSAQNELGGSQGAEKSKIMIGIVCFVWGGGLMLFLFISYREKYYFAVKEEKKQKEKDELMKQLISETDGQQQDQLRNLQKQRQHDELVEKIKEEIFEYIDLLIPAVYNAKETFIQRCRREIGLHHSYVNLVSVDLKRRTSSTRFFKLIKILSVQTVSMFMQAVLFDLQNPQDDGSCSSFTTEVNCLSRKTVLDSSQSYCQWDEQSSQQCFYAQPVFSELAVVYVMIITAICTAIFKLPVDFCLKVWICPVYEQHDFVKSSQVTPLVGVPTENEVSQRVSGDDKQQTTSSSSSLPAMPYLGLKPFFTTPFSFLPGNHSSKVNRVKRRAMPREVPKIHAAMNAFASKISRQTLNQAALLDITQRETDDVEKGIDFQSTMTTEEKFAKELCENIIKCRLQLKDTLLEQLSSKKQFSGKQGLLRLLQENPMWEIYNDQWGILTEPISSLELISSTSYSQSMRINNLQRIEEGDDEEGRSDAVVAENNDRLFQDILQTSLYSTDSREIFRLFEPAAVKQYLIFAQEFQENYVSSQMRLEKLNSENASIELMYLFIMDLLGQTTAAAKIFHNKFNEEYEMVMIVTRIFKILCIAFVFLLNGFFIYFLLLKSVSKGLLWQVQFLKMNISSLLIEIFLFETIECLFLNYVIPESVSKDVYNAVHVLEIIAENLDNFILEQEHHQEQQMTKSLVLSSKETSEFDSSSYLFLSKSLILLKPQLIESFIINSYQNHYPGMICHTWPHYQKRKKLARKREKHKERKQRRLSMKLSKIEPRQQIAAAGIRDEANDLGGTTVVSTNFFTFARLSIAAGIYFTLQSVGILPMLFQKVVVRVLETAILSGLTLLYYISQKQKPYFVVFGAIVLMIFFLVIIKTASKQYEKNKEFQNNVLKKKIEELKERRDREKTVLLSSFPPVISMMTDMWESKKEEEGANNGNQEEDEEEEEEEEFFYDQYPEKEDFTGEPFATEQIEIESTESSGGKAEEVFDDGNDPFWMHFNQHSFHY